MPEPTQTDLENRRDAIDTHLARLAKLPATYKVGSVDVDNTDQMEKLRVERDAIERQIRALSTGVNSFEGPELIVT